MERIDVHCHAVPPKYREYLIETGHKNPDGMPAIPVILYKSYHKIIFNNFAGLEC